MKIFDELTIVFHVSFQKRYCKQKKKKILYQSTWFFPQNITITLPKCAFSGGLWIFRKRYHQKRLPFNDFPKRCDQILGLFLGIFLKERTRQNLNTRGSSNFLKKYLLQVENIHYKLIIANRWSFQNVIIILPATFFEKITLFLFLPSWNSANQWPFQNVITIWLFESVFQFFSRYFFFKVYYTIYLPTRFFEYNNLSHTAFYHSNFKKFCSKDKSYRSFRFFHKFMRKTCALIESFRFPKT